MNRALNSISVTLLSVCCTTVLLAQPSVPRLVKFSGTLVSGAGQPMSGTVGVTFALYENQQGGAPLWMETQNVQADGNGRYSATLGATRNDGIPAEVFASGQGRWLGIQPQGEPERPRVLMTSVPYALKAQDAETLGGLPASAFALAGSANHATAGGGVAEPAAGTVRPTGAAAPDQAGGSGTANYIPIWANATTLGNSKLYETSSGNVGIGTTTATAKFEAITAVATGTAVLGYAASTTGANIGVAGKTVSTSGVAVSGTATATTGNTTGVAGAVSSPNGAGVAGSNSATSGSGVGVSGTANSPTGSGVWAVNNATTGQAFGLSAESFSPTGAGVGGQDNLPGGLGIEGYNGATTGSGAGVSGYSASTSGVGVNGYAGATTGVVFGVSGGTSSSTTNAAGVSGFAGATSGEVFGVTGSTNSPTSGASGVNGFEGATGGGPVYGVSGYTTSTGGVGVFGSASATSGYAVGVEGATASPQGTAGEFVNVSGSGLVLQGRSGSNYTTVFTVDAAGNGTFAGNLTVTGNVSKGGGSFKIDHPLDPENKYLSHSFVESPDMMDVYNGVIRLDARGEAWVNLPDYFEALNGDFRYQLTAIGAPAPRLYVAREVSQNRFKIAGGRPGGKVSWQVTGIRHDAYANAHRIPVTEDKPAAEQGSYLHPDAFRQSGVSGGQR